MYLETYLNAMEKNHDQLVLVGPLHPRHLRALRQYRAFRDRILKMDERNKMRIAELEADLYLLKEWVEKPFPNPDWPDWNTT